MEVGRGDIPEREVVAPEATWHQKQEKQNAPTGRNSEDRQKITPHFLSSLDFKTDDSKGAANGVNRGRQNNLKIIKKL